MANRKKEELHHLMKYYEQAYFTYDDPVPFKKFEVYPVTVKDYYKFYAAIGVMKMDKNSDIEGVAMSNLGYLIHMIENSENGRSLYNQFITMIEMVSMPVGRCSKEISLSSKTSRTLRPKPISAFIRSFSMVRTEKPFLPAMPVITVSES